MRPRHQMQQKQTAHLWCRHNEHRDIISEHQSKMVYHNALYVRNDEDALNEYVWIKYARRLRVFMLRTGNARWGNVDIDRAMVYSTGTHNDTNRESLIRGLKGKVIIGDKGYGNSNYDYYLSEDGVQFKHFYLSGADGGSSVKPFTFDGDIIWGYAMQNGIISHWILDFTDCFEDDFELTKQNLPTVDLGYQPFEYSYFGATEDGCVFKVFDYSGTYGNFWRLFEFTRQGARHLYDFVRYPGNHVISSQFGSSLMRVNGIYFFASATNVAWGSDGKRMHYFRIFYSTNLTDWNLCILNDYDLPYEEVQDYLSEEDYMIPVIRGNEVYIYCAYRGYRVYLWKTSNFVDVVRVNLPIYRDYPVYCGGSYTEPSDEGRTVRLIVAPHDYESIGDDAVEVDLRSMFDTTNIAKMPHGSDFCFEMGEYIPQAERTDKSIFLQTTNTSSRYVAIYSNSMNFIPDDEDFAMLFTESSSSSQYEYDIVIEGDYCAPVGNTTNQENDQQGQTDWSDNIDYHGGD